MLDILTVDKQSKIEWYSFVLIGFTGSVAKGDTACL